MRKDQLIKLLLTVAAAAAFFTTKVHAADKPTSNVHVKEMPAPPKYLVNGKEVNAAEATIAVLKGEVAMKCQQMEVEAGRNGLALKAKKSQ